MTSTALQQRIIERIHKEGPISFADYMRVALYDPDDGYYVTGRARMGWEGGDYFTSADISTFFAHALARQLVLWWQKLGEPARFIVLEQGVGQRKPGAGDSDMGQAYYTRFLCRPRLPDGRYTHGPGCQHTLAVPNTPAPAVILSNELVDAFPVHVVETRNAQLYEVYVDVANGRLCEVLDEPGSAEVANYLDNYHIPWASFGDGWRAEINLDALRWMQHTASRIRHGYILTIDYGDKAKALYTRQRQRGTLACYFQHQMNERPLVRPGEQDITAHVNFSALIDEGRRQGFHLHTFTTQRHWLEGLGIHEELEQRHQHEFAAAETERATDRGQIALLQWRNVRQHVATLTDPDGMGNFKVLVLRR